MKTLELLDSLDKAQLEHLARHCECLVADVTPDNMLDDTVWERRTLALILALQLGRRNTICEALRQTSHASSTLEERFRTRDQQVYELAQEFLRTRAIDIFT